METLDYQLKTDPNRSVKVPADYAEKASELVELALGDPRNLVTVMHELPYLSNPGILTKTMALASEGANSPYTQKLQDEVYLSVCIYGTSRNMDGPDRDEVSQIDHEMVQIVNNL